MDRTDDVELSVAVPIFNEQESLEELHARLTAALRRVARRYEIILVNDGSSDGSWAVILSLASRDPHTKAIGLSRNFGHQVAITAGIDAASGAAVVVMDGDLQDPPEVIESLYGRFLDGYDVVYAQRRARHGETRWKRFTARAFYRVIRRMTTLDIPLDTGDFRLMSRRVVEELRQLQEHSRFIRGLVTWVGYNQVAVAYDRERRSAGESKFSTPRMLKFALDGITSFSSRPLRVASLAGSLLSVASLLLMLGFIIYRVSGGTGLVPGWTSLIVSVLFLGGVQLLAIGLLGEYIGRIYEEVKGRPLYVVKDRLNFPPMPEEPATSSPAGGPAGTVS
jgi:dolichol-phosphate mannosyltransferase